MADTPEPILDLSEIVNLYKEDGQRMVGQMQQIVGQWDVFITDTKQQKEMRRLSHQLRGSGSTYGYRNITRIGKALENIIIKLEKKKLTANDQLQKSMTRKVDSLAAIFKT